MELYVAVYAPTRERTYMDLANAVLNHREWRRLGEVATVAIKTDVDTYDASLREGPTFGQRRLVYGTQRWYIHAVMRTWEADPPAERQPDGWHRLLRAVVVDRDHERISLMPRVRGFTRVSVHQRMGWWFEALVDEGLSDGINAGSWRVDFQPRDIGITSVVE